ncbi:elongation factor P--(R)-beta-lysine ligase [Aestuariibacter halophilus]|uniref:Elongation factor P--(R)-beta-lysine ligase n=1 Tax=Fluctibacter halophilus TaxID=226011 RepID=A0ABS8GBY8_9ALTE|nr:elongation factor P--(R)-beta-lysine ligase [Aestuariibacter halophilus]MCC2617913.1 elongation factor P--(R)-beta-lysine ligase [Aestuariibacter halophilus]
MSDWQPSATLTRLQARAEVMQRIRAFFAARGVLEVETPSLCAAGVTDVHLQAFTTHLHMPGKQQGQQLFLQTSPEYAMKRLLCAGSGPIFQLFRAYRNEEAGRHHNPEFTLLEWYRPGFDHRQLISEVDALMQHVLACPGAEIFTYQQVFVDHVGVDPLCADIEALRDVAMQRGHGDVAENETDKDTLLQLLFCMEVEPRIGQQAPCFVTHFPASQAALARIDEQDPRTARRFELYYKGMELANGFHELADADEQQARFEQDNQQRQRLGLPQVPLDHYLLDALRSGLPDCAGVALGVDRLVMLACGAREIKEVLSFSYHNA